MTVVDPGYFRTDFLDQRSLSRSERVIDDYAATVGALRELAQALLHTLIRAAVGGEHTFPLVAYGLT